MSIFGRRHSKLTGSDVGSIIWQSVTDSAARLALTVTSDKNGRIVRQESDGSYWVLDDYSVPTWRELTSVGVAAVTSVAGEVGDVTVADMALVLSDITDIDLTGLADDFILKYDSGTATWKVEMDAGGGGGVSDHGALTGLTPDDDHPQYHNDTRGDLRYYTQTQVDTSLTGKSDTGHPHVLLDITDSGTAAQIDVGVVNGTIPVLEDVGGVPGLPAVDGTQLTGVPGDVQTAIDLKTDQTDFADHSARHENTGADEISVAGLSGLLADGQTPLTHASSHEDGGSDEIAVTDLSGLLADEQYSAIQDGGVPETDEGGLAHTINFGSNLAVTGIASGVVTVTSTGGSDATAIHTDANNEISGITEETTPVGADIVVIEDSTASYVKKKVQLSNLPGGISLEEDSAPVANTPHSTLNFIGDTVTAADVDGSEATITVASFGTGAGTVSEGDHTHDTLANVAQDVILGRTTAGSGDSEELSVAAAQTLLNVEDGSVAAGTSGDAYATSHEADTSAHNAGEITNDSSVAGVYVDDALNTLLSDKASSTDLNNHTSDGTIHFTEGSIDHTAITSIGSNSHTTIDDHLALDLEHRNWTADQGATNIDVNNVPLFAGSTEGLVPTSVGGTANFMRADGSWAIPPSVGDASFLQLSAQKGTAGTITAGQAVYITGYDAGAGVIEVELADASSVATMPAYGIASSSIEQAVTGTVVVSGELTGQVTNGYSEGDALYISETAGALTDTKPQSPAVVQEIGIVSYSHLSAGIIQIFGGGRINDKTTLANLGAGTLNDLNAVVADATLYKWEQDQGATNIDPGNVPVVTASDPGLAPTFPDNTTTYLRGDGTYAVPPGSASTHKDSVRVASAAAGTLASDFENGDTVDGVALVTGDRILIKNQATASENGIYTVEATGAPTRATDLDTASSAAGMSVLIEVGTANASSYWHCTAVAGSDVVGTDNLPYELTGVPADDVTIEIDATNGLQIKDAGVTGAKLGAMTAEQLSTALINANIGGTSDLDIPRYTDGSMFVGATDIGTPNTVDRIPIQDDTDDSIKYVEAGELARPNFTIIQHFKYTDAGSSWTYYAPPYDPYDVTWTTDTAVPPSDDERQGIIVPSGYTTVDITVWLRMMVGAVSAESKNARVYKRAITHDASQGANSLLIAETGSGNITSGTDPWAKITLAQTTVAAGEMLLVGVDNDTSVFGSHLTYGQVILEFSP